LAVPATLVSAVIGAFGVGFLVAMFAAFAVGAKPAGQTLGWINDALVLLSYLLAVPAAIALGRLLRLRGPILSLVATALGLVGIGAIVVFQFLLVIGVLTFEQEIGPASIAFVALAAWLVMTGYLGRSSGVLPEGLRMGIVGATYIGYPIWAFWMSRQFARLGATSAHANA
jgi:hypothetical protein